MRRLQVKMYSVLGPLVLLPLMDMSVSQIPDYLKGMEFRGFLSEIIIQVLSGVMEALITGIFGGFFGILGS